MSKYTYFLHIHSNIYNLNEVIKRLKILDPRDLAACPVAYVAGGPSQTL